MPAATDPELRWFTIYVHICDADPRGAGERPTEGKQYVGQAIHSIQDIKRGFTNVAERAMWTRWRHKLREGTLLSRAVQQFGPEKFSHKVLDIVLGQTAANRAEDEWITRLDSLEPRGYNRKRGGQTPLTHEEHSELCKRGWAAIPVARRKDIIYRGQKTLGPVGLSKRSSKRAVTMGPEKLSAAILKGHKTRGPKGWAAAIAKRKKNMDFSAASQKAMITLGPDGLSQRAQKAVETLGSDGIQERAFKTGMTKILRGLQRAMVSRDLLELRRLLSLGFAVSVRLPSH